MFSGSILFGDYVPLISLGTIIRTVEVSINLIFDNSLTELNLEVSERNKRYCCGTAQYGTSTTTVVLLHVTPQNHGMADTRVATLEVARARECSLG